MNHKEQLKALRKEYKIGALDENSVKPDPIEEFEAWMNKALEAGCTEPNAMLLATAGKSGVPSARVVLLKEYNEKGFVFYTNYDSRKGNEISENPVASALFFWKELERQVRITGTVEKVTTKESDEYYHSRPIGARIGAWASEQSRVIPNRKYIDDRFKEFENQFKDKAVPRPAHWGGYRINPERIEFWQGRDNRLNDRIEYTKVQDNWQIVRLSP